MSSRRDFLKKASALAVLAAPVFSLEAALVPPRYLRFERFAALVETEFSVFSENGAKATVMLVDARAKSLQWNFEEFSLVFEGPASLLLGQGTYRFKHRKIIGPFEVFIVPNAGGRGPRYYEAVFNRFLV